MRYPDSTTRADLIIRNAAILDGLGGPVFHADVAITGTRISAVGNLGDTTAVKERDAAGMTLAPGFIDIHTHSDISVPYDPGQGSAIAMGVTTQVVGNCGLSVGFAQNRELFGFEKRAIEAHGGRLDWDDFAGSLRAVEDLGPATNYVPLAGHGTLRKRVVGMENRPADATEMREMRLLLAEALEAGAWGLSSGLEYPPSSHAGEAELVELCLEVALSAGIYATHLRNEGDTLQEAVQEALNVARTAEIPLQLSHHKAEGRRNWGKVGITLPMVTAARADGMDVQLDQYPYTAFMTSLAVQTLPRWALNGSQEDTLARLRDPAQRDRMAKEMAHAHPEWDDANDRSAWEAIRIGVVRARPELQGQSIADLARNASIAPISYVLELLAQTEGFISAINFAIDEADIAAVMQYPFTSIGSDGVGTHVGGSASHDRIHPRAYGCFPRVLGRYVRELGVLTEPEAIRRMTSLPADRLGLKDRGRIAPGYFADITVYDSAIISDLATYDEPHQYAQGISMVLVNGRPALEQGNLTGTRAGSVLRRTT
ncbi:MAG: D-aminoacylase [Armatimonadetes bacterium]|nr:D-aminoacylase [Armatimonadota bacterium]MDE2206183.1 D-aminoacylase [Armatimonadota bacterium]